MIYESSCTKLISEWVERSQNQKYSDDYRKAIAECAFELECTINSLIEEEFNINQYLNEQEADTYLSSMEAHEVA